MRILQVLDLLDYGDAVSNDTLILRKMIRELGFESEIYSLFCDSKVEKERLPFETLSLKNDDIVFHHFSGRSFIAEKLLKMPGKKCMIYHNITPPKFMKGINRDHCEVGLRQAASLEYDYYIAVSEFNAIDLKRLGVEKDIFVLPIILDFENNKKNIIYKKNGHKIVFIGRFAPNKCIEDIIKVFAKYNELFDSESELIMPGNANVDPEYFDMISKLIASCNCKERIKLPGKILDDEKDLLLKSADCYISMSEHEGFCVPLVEAMSYSVPVFAYDAGAVRDTMSGAGVLFDRKDPEFVARLLNTVFADEDILNQIVNKQHEVIKRFNYESIKPHLEQIINEIKDD